jgi:hypothetical protein
MIKGSLGSRMAPLVAAMLGAVRQGAIWRIVMLYMLVSFSEQIGTAERLSATSPSAPAAPS